jgi:hypothetical protein
MSNFEELYCAHVEQIGARYPDAWHVRYVWAVAPTQIESKVFFGDEAVVLTSVVEPNGAIRHFVEPYTPWDKKKPAATGFVPTNL